MSGPPDHREDSIIQRYQGTLADNRPAPGRKRRHVLAWTMSGAAHLAVIAGIVWLAAMPAAEPPSIPITLVQVPEQETPGPEGPPGPPGPPGPEGLPGPPAPQLEMPKIEIAVPQPVVRPTPKARTAARETPDAEPAPVDTFSDVLSDSQLAGAASAESEGAGGGNNGGGGGGGGGGCDTARIVQQALRKDPRVHSAVAGANRLGKAVMLWNGDWVRSGIEDGKGLSAVREAIVWELAFSPPACRDKRVRGPVLLSLADGRTRFLIGSSDWRWSDLLELR